MLDRRIRVDSYTESQDTFGEPVKTYALLDTMYARVEPLTGRELFEAQQLSAELPAKFHVRYRSDINETMQIVFDGDVYGIESIAEVGRRDGLEILARRKPAIDGNEAG